MKKACSQLLPQSCSDHIVSVSLFQESDHWENVFLCGMELQTGTIRRRREETSGLKGGRRRHDGVAFIIIIAATTFILKTLRKTLLLLLDLQNDRQTQLSSQKIFTKKSVFPTH
jgi:hypothetical protein